MAVKDWTDEWEGVDQTALCPRCGIDAVIGSKSGFPITTEFLETMKTHWFQMDRTNRTNQINERNEKMTSEDVTVCRVGHMTCRLKSGHGNSAVRPCSWREVLRVT